MHARPRKTLPARAAHLPRRGSSKLILVFLAAACAPDPVHSKLVRTGSGGSTSPSDGAPGTGGAGTSTGGGASSSDGSSTGGSGPDASSPDATEASDDARVTDATALDDAAADAPGRDGSGPEASPGDSGVRDSAADTGIPADGGAAYTGPVFTEVSLAAGFTLPQGPPERSPDCGIADIAGCDAEFTGGAAAADYDGDGFPDLYVTRIGAPGTLYRNKRDGTFEDVTAQAGLAMGSGSNGAVWGDVERDGDLDLFVTTMNDTRFYLFVNQGNGTFVEDALRRNVAAYDGTPRHGFSATFGDYDRDGYVDLHTTEWRKDAADGGVFRSANRLFRNCGTIDPGIFEETTSYTGVSLETSTYPGGVWSFTSTFADLDGDKWPDLAVASDFQTSRLFWNQGNGSFLDGTYSAGVAHEHNAMGSAIGDYDGDGRLDWFVTSIDCDEPACPAGAPGNALYRNIDGRTFADDTDSAGVRHGGWGWGTAFLDYDNDGDRDLVMTSGMDVPDDDAGLFRVGRISLFRNDGPARSPTMVEVGAAAGLSMTGQGRGLVVLDYDKDGDEDVFVVRRADTPLLFRNDGGSAGGYLNVRLQGTRSDPFGYGARVTVIPRPGTLPEVQELTAGGFLGSSEPVLHFGLGPSGALVSQVHVAWPLSGTEQVLRDVTPDTTVFVKEP